MTILSTEPASSQVGQAERMQGIEQKLDVLAASVESLGEQIQMLAAYAHENQRRQREWDELRADLTPVVNDMYSITVEQLQEIQAYVQLEDVLGLAKRLARNTRNFNNLLNQMESMQDLWADMSPLTTDMFHQVVLTLNDLERKGYFAFAKEGAYVLDQVVTSFTEDDVRQLGDNVVLILNTVKALTQPEVMNLVNNLTEGFHEAEDQVDDLPTSTFGLLRQVRDPDVRRGLAITMAMLKRVSQQQASTTVVGQTAKRNGSRQL
ncbi:MAG: DUF1641 domain-containing protein [Caldilineaceae bacterium]